MNVLYEDNHIIVAVKPQNIPTQADASGDADFLSMVKAYVRRKYGKPGEAYIGLVHRLDRPAGGVMAFARTSKAAARVSRQIADGGMEKNYFAVVDEGVIADAAVLEDYLVKDGKTNNSRVAGEAEKGAKHARLGYKTIESSGGVSLLDIALETGRPHQIRAQMAHAGEPLIGDWRYGGRRSEKLCLWSYHIGIVHPIKKERMDFFCPPPDEWPWNLFETGINGIFEQIN
jgi:23S rRNA pseudouridine1911/1915/1917 synthase